MFSLDVSSLEIRYFCERLTAATFVGIISVGITWFKVNNGKTRTVCKSV